MKIARLIATLIIGLIAVLPARATRQEPVATSARSEETLTLEDATPVKLKLLRDLSSTKEKVEDAVEFEVIEEVRVGEIVVIERGASATGTVIDAKSARRMGRAGKLDVRIDSVRLANGKRALLRAVRKGPDGSLAKEVAMNVAVTGALFFPVAPLFLLQKGENISVPKGTLVTSFVNGDHSLMRAEFSR